MNQREQTDKMRPWDKREEIDSESDSADYENIPKKESDTVISSLCDQLNYQHIDVSLHHENECCSTVPSYVNTSFFNSIKTCIPAEVEDGLDNPNYCLNTALNNIVPVVCTTGVKSRSIVEDLYIIPGKNTDDTDDSYVVPTESNDASLFHVEESCLYQNCITVGHSVERINQASVLHETSSMNKKPEGYHQEIHQTNSVIPKVRNPNLNFLVPPPNSQPELLPGYIPMNDNTPKTKRTFEFGIDLNSHPNLNFLVSPATTKHEMPPGYIPMNENTTINVKRTFKYGTTSHPDLNLAIASERHVLPRDDFSLNENISTDTCEPKRISIEDYLTPESMMAESSMLFHFNRLPGDLGPTATRTLPKSKREPVKEIKPKYKSDFLIKYSDGYVVPEDTDNSNPVLRRDIALSTVSLPSRSSQKHRRRNSNKGFLKMLGLFFSCYGYRTRKRLNTTDNYTSRFSSRA